MPAHVRVSSRMEGQKHAEGCCHALAAAEACKDREDMTDDCCQAADYLQHQSSAVIRRGQH